MSNQINDQLADRAIDMVELAMTNNPTIPEEARLMLENEALNELMQEDYNFKEKDFYSNLVKAWVKVGKPQARFFSPAGYSDPFTTDHQKELDFENRQEDEE